jgi:hypothetical protein
LRNERLLFIQCVRVITHGLDSAANCNSVKRRLESGGKSTAPGACRARLNPIADWKVRRALDAFNA